MVNANDRPIALVGLPGSGKSRVGRALAGELGRTHIDTDDVIVKLAGKSVPRIFTEDGEDAFRALEALAVQESLKSGHVVSLGGGAIETDQVRELLQAATVVYIEAELGELLRRVKRNDKRPLLRDDPEGTLRALTDRRVPLYTRVADLTVTTSSASFRGVVRQAVSALHGLHLIEVQANPHYPVVSGWDCAELALDEYPVGTKRALVLVAPGLEKLAEKLQRTLATRGTETHLFVLPAGEAAKTLESAANIWDLAGSIRLGRADAIVTVGGGATTDLGGFIAATWLRGIRVIHFPTSLLAMVDAAVGGKTGINSAAGKNLIGAFHNPQLVVADLGQLQTLSEAEFISGLAEVIKAGFIADPRILELVEQNPMIGSRRWATGEGRAVLHELVDRAIRVKARVVGQDFREAGLRETLNYGHTLAHGIEKQTDYRTRHGEAVAVGMVLAAQIAVRRGLISEELFERHRGVLTTVGLPVSYEGDAAELVDLMYSDKKTRGNELRFALLTGLGSAGTFTVDRGEVVEAMFAAFDLEVST